MSKIDVVICAWDEQFQRIWGAHSIESFNCLVAATIYAQAYVAKEKSVVIRPCYDEVDQQGKRFFREWRSLHGRPFEQSRWGF